MFVVSTIFSIFSYFNFTIIICNLQEKNGKSFAARENFLLCFIYAKKNGARYEQDKANEHFLQEIYFL